MWNWMDFSKIDRDDRMDTRRAAFLVYDFVNMFNIEDFKVIASDGDWQNKRIEIAYRIPVGKTQEEIEEDWYEHLKRWREKV